MADRRVVVTGMGALACNGIDVPSFWRALQTGKSGIGPFVGVPNIEIRHAYSYAERVMYGAPDVAELKDVANAEKMMPRDYITADGFHITDKCRRYLEPLVLGEDYPPYRNGLPAYVKLKNAAVPKKLGAFKI